MRRRSLLLLVGSLAAGCLGSDRSTDGASETTSGPANGLTVKTVNAANVRRGADEQRITVALSGATGGEAVDLQVDVGSLREAGVSLTDLGVEAEARYGVGWTVTDAAIEGDVVRISVTVDDSVSVDDIGTIEIWLTGLNSESIEHTTGLVHHFDITGPGEAPKFEDGMSVTYNVVDPSALENVLRVRPSRLRVGDPSHRVNVTIEHATNEVAFRMDISPLSEIGVGIAEADLEVEMIENNVEEDLESVEVVEAGVSGGVVQLDLQTEAEMIGLVLLLTGLDTDDVEAGSELSYPVWVGKRQESVAESQSFRVAGATA